MAIVFRQSILILDSDKLPAYSDIRDAEVIVLDDEQYDKYCRLKKEVMALR